VRLRAQRGVREQPGGGRVVDRGLRHRGRGGGEDQGAEQGKREPALHADIIGARSAGLKRHSVRFSDAYRRNDHPPGRKNVASSSGVKPVIAARGA
jgi:hypothetical protein